MLSYYADIEGKNTIPLGSRDAGPAWAFASNLPFRPSPPPFFFHVNARGQHARVNIRIELEQAKRVNPKRLRRMIEREIRASARRGTKSQQVVAEQREAAKAERRSSPRALKEELRREKFAKRTEKRKRKHCGR